MIATGSSPSSDYYIITEVVDVKSGEICAVLTHFPFPNNGAVGANLDGTPAVCGGYASGSYYQTCYHLTDPPSIMPQWQEFASMKMQRRDAAGVMFQDKFHVFGGYDYDYGILQTSEHIRIDGGVAWGPQLPTAVFWHAITSINLTVSILSGGTTMANEYSPLTWYFNHETNIFSDGPSLLQGRKGHASETCVDKVTKAKIPIVTGGYGTSNVPMDSTEMLINGQWHSGTI